MLMVKRIAFSSTMRSNNYKHSKYEGDINKKKLKFILLIIFHLNFRAICDCF